MFRHFVPSRELHSLATLVRLSLVDLPSANSMKCCSPPASLEKQIPKIRPLTGRTMRKVDGLFLSPKSKIGGQSQGQNRKPLNSSEPKRNEQRRSLRRNSTSWSVWRTERSIWRKANAPSAPTAFAIWAARLRALPRRSKISHAPK